MKKKLSVLLALLMASSTLLLSGFTNEPTIIESATIRAQKQADVAPANDIYSVLSSIKAEVTSPAAITVNFSDIENNNDLIANVLVNNGFSDITELEYNKGIAQSLITNVLAHKTYSINGKDFEIILVVSDNDSNEFVGIDAFTLNNVLYQMNEELNSYIVKHREVFNNKSVLTYVLGCERSSVMAYILENYIEKEPYFTMNWVDDNSFYIESNISQ